MIKDLALEIAKALVDHPELVNIYEEETENSVIIGIEVHTKDIGQILGRHGRTVNSIRQVLNGVARRYHKHLKLYVVE